MSLSCPFKLSLELSSLVEKHMGGTSGAVRRGSLLFLNNDLYFLNCFMLLHHSYLIYFSCTAYFYLQQLYLYKKMFQQVVGANLLMLVCKL